MRVDVSFLPVLGATFMLMFARIGTMVMLLPGLGELTVPARVRLTLALVLTAVLFPLHRAAFTLDLKSFGPVLTLLGQELFIGAVLGLTARLTISALQVAGSVVAQQLGLGFITAVDPTQGQQGVIVANFRTLLGVTLIFATDLHHYVLAACTRAMRCSIRARSRPPATSRRWSRARPPPPSASASSSPGRSWCSASCSTWAWACCRG